MEEYIKKSKTIFFEENFSKAFELQEKKLLKFFSKETAKEKVSSELEKQWLLMKDTFQEEVDLFFRECERRLTLSDLEALKEEALAI